MTSLRLPTDVRDRYDRLADDLDGFDGGEDLARYVLDAAADELSRGEATDASTDASGGDANRADDAVVEDRLERLGYLEK